MIAYLIFSYEYCYNVLNVRELIILKDKINEYLVFCKEQKMLSDNSLKAYRIDLYQFSDYIGPRKLCKELLLDYISYLHTRYKVRTVKRKITCIKTFLKYMKINLFADIELKYDVPKELPKTIPLNIIKRMLKLCVKNVKELEYKSYHWKIALRDLVVLELLFSTGARVSEICNINCIDIDLLNCTIKVNGKGNKERYLYITDKNVRDTLKQYIKVFSVSTGKLLINRFGKPLSTHAVRDIVNKYTKEIGYNKHITPHMFRHTFATSLLEKDVDIRYIQNFLGHQSISTTQIYTYVTNSKSKKILEKKHPISQMLDDET